MREGGSVKGCMDFSIRGWYLWGIVEGPPGEGMVLFSPGHARASVNTWRGLFEPSVNTYLEGDVKVYAPLRSLLNKCHWHLAT